MNICPCGCGQRMQKPRSKRKSINIKLSSNPITAKARKLKAIWTVESEQTLNDMHNIDWQRTINETLMKTGYVG
jgi:hypothetical protein